MAIIKQDYGEIGEIGSITFGQCVRKAVSYNATIGDFATTKRAIGFTMNTINGSSNRSYTITCFGTSAYLAYDKNGNIQDSGNITLDVTYSDNAIIINNVAGNIHSDLNSTGFTWNWTLTPLYDS